LSDLGAYYRWATQNVISNFRPVHDSKDPFMKPLIERDNAQNDYVWWLLFAGMYIRVFANIGFKSNLRPYGRVRSSGN
jgi:hypothetical protein